MDAHHTPAVPTWDHQLQRYLYEGVLAGYALIGAAGQCVSAEGVLRSGLLPQASSQLSAAFHDPDRPPARLELCGQAAVVVRGTACDLYATFPRRRASVCVSNLPSGVLVCVGPPPLPVLAPLVFEACAALRR